MVCAFVLLQVIGSQIERQQDDNACLAYWLTNTVTLLHLLQRNIKPASGSSGSVKRVAAAGRSLMGGLFGRQPGAGAAMSAALDACTSCARVWQAAISYGIEMLVLCLVLYHWGNSSRSTLLT